MLKDFLSGVNNEPSSKRLIMFMNFLAMVLFAILAVFGKVLPEFMWNSFFYTGLVCLGVIGVTNVADLIRKK